MFRLVNPTILAIALAVLGAFALVACAETHEPPLAIQGIVTGPSDLDIMIRGIDVGPVYHSDRLITEY